MPEQSEQYESVYEEVAALRRLVGLADAMFVQMKDEVQSQHDAFSYMAFGHNGGSLAGALDGADRAYVFHRHREGPKLGLPPAMEALGQGSPSPERRVAMTKKRDRFIAHITAAVEHFDGDDGA